MEQSGPKTKEPRHVRPKAGNIFLCGQSFSLAISRGKYSWGILRDPALICPKRLVMAQPLTGLFFAGGDVDFSGN
jgi:hypothetical protein